MPIFWIFYGVFFTNFSLSVACQTQPCTLKQYSFSRDRDSMENYALFGYTFKNLTVTSHKNCFEHCAWDCRCISFNYLTTAKKDNCQLNEENKYLKPGALKRKEGYSYHEIGIDYNVKVREAKKIRCKIIRRYARFLSERLLGNSDERLLGNKRERLLGNMVRTWREVAR